MIIEEDRSDTPPFVGASPGSVAPPAERPVDRLRELLEQWWPGMLLLLVPFAVGVLALVLSRQSDPDQQAVVTIASETGESGSLGSLNLAAPPPAPTTAPPLTTAAPSTLYASTTVPSTTAPVTSRAPVTTQAPAPTARPTQPPTSAPPPTSPSVPPTVTEPPAATEPASDACIIRVRRARVYASPDDGAERIGRASGRYTVIGAQAGWYQIASGGDTGWVSSGDVAGSSGPC
ncbi:MAG: SH3 domain-containing protein [Acidimicrobiales bacterium]